MQALKKHKEYKNHCDNIRIMNRKIIVVVTGNENQINVFSLVIAIVMSKFFQ